MGIQSLRLLQFITAIIYSNKIKRWDLCYREKKLERPKILKIMKLRKAKNIKMKKWSIKKKKKIGWPIFWSRDFIPNGKRRCFPRETIFLKKKLSCNIQPIRMIRVLYGIRSRGPEETGMVELGLLNDRASLQLTL